MPLSSVQLSADGPRTAARTTLLIWFSLSSAVAIGRSISVGGEKNIRGER